jgi:site-specific DNA-methyltransferase (adenine-specific)
MDCYFVGGGGMYQHENIKIMQGDCMDLMAKTADKFYDLCICDPPYGIKESSKNRNGIVKNIDKRNGRVSYIETKSEVKNWDDKPMIKEYYLELKRVSKNQIIFGANHFIQDIPEANSSSWIVWDKCNGDSDFADCELAYTSFNGAVRLFRYMWSGMFKGKNSLTEGHIFEGDLTKHEKRIHKTQKPVILYQWLLKNYAKPNDKILDTHLGSGSIAIAVQKANQLDNANFDFTGIELDQEYYEAAVKRFKAFAIQKTINF